MDCNPLTPVAIEFWPVSAIMPHASSLGSSTSVGAGVACKILAHLKGCVAWEPLQQDKNILVILNDIQQSCHSLERNLATLSQTNVTDLITKSLVNLAVLELAARGGFRSSPYICEYLEKLQKELALSFTWPFAQRYMSPKHQRKNWSIQEVTQYQSS